jgi:hypothetical protein
VGPLEKANLSPFQKSSFWNNVGSFPQPDMMDSVQNTSYNYSYSHAYRTDKTIMVTCPTWTMHEITTHHHHLLKAAENHCQLSPVWQV